MVAPSAGIAGEDHSGRGRGLEVQRTPPLVDRKDSGYPPTNNRVPSADEAEALHTWRERLFETQFPPELVDVKMAPPVPPTPTRRRVPSIDETPVPQLGIDAFIVLDTQELPPSGEV